MNPSDANKVLAASLINAMVVAADIEKEAMMVENHKRRDGGFSDAYTEDNFFELVTVLQKGIVSVQRQCELRDDG